MNDLNNPNRISIYTWPGQVHFGFGVAELAGQLAKERKAHHVFVIGDSGIILAGLLKPVEVSLRAAGLSFTVYDGVKPNPDGESVETAASAFRDSDADFIIGIGGGSGLDTAKAVQLLADGQARIAEYDLFLGLNVRPAPLKCPRCWLFQPRRAQAAKSQPGPSSPIRL